MKKAHWQKVIENKYSILLTALVAMIVISPTVTHSDILSFIGQSLLFVIIILAMLRILGAGRVLFVACCLVAGLAIILDYLYISMPDRSIVLVLSSLAYLVCMGLTIVFMLKVVFGERSVTADTVKGSISLYILIGIWWESLYSLMWALDRASFIYGAAVGGLPDFFYFSFTTMTTLGYGDILPTSQGAKVASILEAMTGQVYLAVFVARLVGLHIAGPGRDS